MSPTTGAGRRPAGPSPGPVAPDSAPDVGLLVAAAMAPETFAPSLSSRSALDQGLVTGLATGLHYLLSVGTQDLLEAAGDLLPDRSGGRAGTSAPRGRGRTLAADCVVIPLGLAVTWSLPPRPGESAARGVVRQVAWRFGATGLGGALLVGAEAGVRTLDARVGAGGHLASIPLAVPIGVCLSYVGGRRGEQPAGGDARAGRAPPALAAPPGGGGGGRGGARGAGPRNPPPRRPGRA